MQPQRHFPVDTCARDGYLIVPDLFSAAECASMCRESVAVCRGERGTVAGVDAAAANLDERDLMARYMACVMVHKPAGMPGTRMNGSCPRATARS